MTRGEIVNAFRQEGQRMRVRTDRGPGWAYGPLDDSGRVRVALDAGGWADVPIADVDRPRRPAPRTDARPVPRTLRLSFDAGRRITPLDALSGPVGDVPPRPRPSAPPRPVRPSERPVAARRRMARFDGAVTHWHVWLAADPGVNRPISMLRRIARPFSTRQGAREWAIRREPDTRRTIVRGCTDERCRHNRPAADGGGNGA